MLLYCCSIPRELEASMPTTTINNSASTGFVNPWVIGGLLAVAGFAFLWFIWKRRAFVALAASAAFMFLVNIAIGTIANWDVAQNSHHGWSSLPGWVFNAPVYLGIVLSAAAIHIALAEKFGLTFWRRQNSAAKLKDRVRVD